MATGVSAQKAARTPRMHDALGTRLWWPWLLVGMAWALAALASMAGQRILIDHHYLLEESGLSWPVAAGVFLAGWQVMIAAMIPMCLPALARANAPNGMHPHRAASMFLTGYAQVWTVFGLLAFTGDTLLHRLVDAWPWLAAHTFLIGAATFAGAGLFQFSRWKAACLGACRHPHAALGDGALAGVRRAHWGGIWYGHAAAGCCWALMLVMFGVGVGGLGWMIGLTGAMLAETLLPERWRARQATGIVLLTLAALWLAHPTWLMVAAAL